MQPLQLRLHEERKARLVRMKAWQEKPPVVQLPKRDTPAPPPEVVLTEAQEAAAQEEANRWSKPPRRKTWFWTVNKADEEALRVHHVLKAVAAYYDRNPKLILSDRRTADIVRPRMVVCYVARKLTNATLVTIGKVLKKDHTTVLHAVQKLSPTAHEDGEIQQIIEALIGEPVCLGRPTDWLKHHENTQDKPSSDEQGREVPDGIPGPPAGG